MGPPTFFTKIFFTKMSQNGLKRILNTTLKSVKFCHPGPPPGVKNVTLFLRLLLIKSLRIYFFTYVVKHLTCAVINLFLSI